MYPGAIGYLLMISDLGRLVRDQAFKAVELFVNRLETHAATMVNALSVLEPVCIAYNPPFRSPKQRSQTMMRLIYPGLLVRSRKPPS